jgi:hypothetical protein
MVPHAESPPSGQFAEYISIGYDIPFDNHNNPAEGDLPRSLHTP